MGRAKMTNSLEFQRFEEAESQEWRSRWPSFSPAELACKHCNRLVVNAEALDLLQRARARYGDKIRIASAYRCPEHPIEAAKPDGPGPHSRGTAFDAYPVAPGGKPRFAWIKACLFVGFWGFGMGAEKLHFDHDELLGQRAWFYGK